jgi:uncharacterized protein
VSTTTWLVPITALRRTLGSQREEHRHGPLGGLRVADSVVPAATDVAVDVVMTAVDGGLEVAGTVRGDWAGECRGVLTTDVRELYRPRAVGEPDDEETYPLGGDHLDLAPLARDALLLALPLAPLCRDDCAGLCPICGTDLTDSTCSCVTPVGDPRWAALDILGRRDDADAGSTS